MEIACGMERGNFSCNLKNIDKKFIHTGWIIEETKGNLEEILKLQRMGFLDLLLFPEKIEILKDCLDKPSFEIIVQEEYKSLLKVHNTSLMLKLFEMTKVKPDINQEDIMPFLEKELMEEEPGENGNYYRIKELYSLMPHRLDDDKVQGRFREMIDKAKDEPFWLIYLEQLEEATGTRLSERLVQGAYAACVDEGITVYLLKDLHKLTGIRPDFSPAQATKIYMAGIDEARKEYGANETKIQGIAEFILERCFGDLLEIVGIPPSKKVIIKLRQYFAEHCTSPS